MSNIEVRISSKYHAKRLTFKYSIDLFAFVCATDWGAALFVLYLPHFSIVSDVLRCIRKVLRTAFQPSRNPCQHGLKVSTTIHVETLIPLPHVLFTSANVNDLLGILKVCAPTKFHEYS